MCSACLDEGLRCRPRCLGDWQKGDTMWLEQRLPVIPLTGLRMEREAAWLLDVVSRQFWQPKQRGARLRFCWQF